MHKYSAATEAHKPSTPPHYLLLLIMATCIDKSTHLPWQLKHVINYNVEQLFCRSRIEYVPSDVNKSARRQNISCLHKGLCLISLMIYLFISFQKDRIFSFLFGVFFFLASHYIQQYLVSAVRNIITWKLTWKYIIILKNNYTRLTS